MASDRAAHTAPEEADRGRGGAEARWDSHRGPDRAADPRGQRLAGKAQAAPRAAGGRKPGLDRRRRSPPPRGGTGYLVRLAARAPPGPDPALRAAVREGCLHEACGGDPAQLAGLARAPAEQSARRRTRAIELRRGDRHHARGTRSRRRQLTAGAAAPALLSARATLSVPSAQADASQNAAGYPPSVAAIPASGAPRPTPRSKKPVKVPSAAPRRPSGTWFTTTSE